MHGQEIIVGENYFLDNMRTKYQKQKDHHQYQYNKKSDARYHKYILFVEWLTWRRKSKGKGEDDGIVQQEWE